MPESAAKIGSIRSRALADIQPDTVDADAGTVNAVLSTGEGRWFFDTYEELVPAGANLNSLNEGGPVVLDHKRAASNVVGRVVPGTAKVQENQVEAQLAFSEDTDAWPLIRDGFLNQVSLGYRIDKVEETSNGDGTVTARVTDWTPIEVSLVAVAAESNSRIRSADQHAGQENPDTFGAAGRLHIANRARNEGFNDIAERAASGKLSGADASKELMTRLEEKELETMTEPHVRAGTLDAVEQFRAAATDALAARINRSEPETSAGRDAMAYSLSDMAAETLRQRGDAMVSTTPRAKLVDRAMHTSSDFATVVSDAANKAALQAYRVRQTPLRRLAREVDLQDFKPSHRIQLGQPPKLEKVREHGEFKRGTTDERGETLQLDTYGITFSFTRQLIINDDIDLFGDWVQRFSDSATRLEAEKIAQAFLANSGAGPAMSDGDNFFSTGHANIAASSQIGVSGMSEAQKLLRKQTDVNSDAPLNLSPSYIVTNSDDEVAARQLVAEIQPNSTDSVNPFAGNLEVLTDARLDDENAWWVFASQNQAPTIEVAFLNGQRGPTINTRAGFDIDGMEVRIRHDFDAGVVDFRGGVKIPKA